MEVGAAVLVERNHLQRAAHVLMQTEGRDIGSAASDLERALMADPRTVTDELVAIRRTIYSQPGFAESMRHILCLQDPEIRRRNLITDAELAAVPHGAMVVWTSNDPSGPASAGMEMAEKIRGGRFEHISGAGHWPQWEQRDKFNQLVLGFLAEEHR